MSVPAADPYRELYLSAPCGLLCTDIGGAITEINDTLLVWIGRDRDAVTGQPFGSLLETGSRVFYETRQVPVLHLHDAVEVSLTLRRDDGSMLPVLISSVIVRDAGGEPSAVRTAVFDASARQEYERELLLARRSAEQSEARVAALKNASSAFGSSSSERGLSDELANAARTAFEAAEVGVFLIDEESRFWLAGGSYPLEEWIPVGSVGLGSESLNSGEIRAFGTLAEVRAESPTLADAMDNARLVAISIVPMLEDGVAVGVFVSWFGRPHDFDSQFIELQEALGRQAAQTLLRLRLQRQLERLALHDQLTGLANRALIQEEVNRAIAASTRQSCPMAVIFIDLDGFKAVNDRLGHGEGDSVLRQVARRLKTGVRQQDVVGRFGGDEFVAICENADEEAAASIAERIRSVIDAPYDGLPDELRITASVGVVTVPGDGESEPSADELLNLADNAMYRSKSTGKNLVSVARRLDRPPSRDRH